METRISSRQSPEKIELERYRKELAGVSEQLADRELELATLQRNLAAFEHAYLSTVGKKQAELDAIEAEVARILQVIDPDDEHLKSNAEEWSKRASESAEAAGSAIDEPRGSKSQPSETLRELYKTAARQIHPDLATTDKERKLRERLMADVNDAYERGDGERIERIIDEWRHAPEQVTGEDIGSEIVRVIRQINQVRSRIAKVDVEIERLSASALAVLKAKCDEAAEQGRDLLAEMRRTLGSQIESAMIRLESLKAHP